jgi:small subunit ribosomal protein S7
MPRRNTIFPTRDYHDPRYHNADIGKLINAIMISGKKETALNIVYGAMDVAAAKLKKDQIEVFNQILENITPVVEVKARRIGGANYQVPTEIKPRRRLSLALRWLVQTARTRPGKPMTDKLALEMIDAYNNTGAVVKKKEETHKMAEANKALAHFSKF